MDAKTKAIISHITWIGWVIALVVNSKEKDELTSFYIRQTLGIFLLSFVAMIPMLRTIVGIAMVIFWIISLIGAVQGEMKPIPIIGEYFQEWFKGL
jgi:uncharacterized membrane protein